MEIAATSVDQILSNLASQPDPRWKTLDLDRQRKQIQTELYSRAPKDAMMRLMSRIPFQEAPNLAEIDWESELSTFETIQCPQYYLQPFHSVLGGYLSETAAVDANTSMEPTDLCCKQCKYEAAQSKCTLQSGLCQRKQRRCTQTHTESLFANRETWICNNFSRVEISNHRSESVQSGQCWNGTAQGIVKLQLTEMCPLSQASRFVPPLYYTPCLSHCQSSGVRRVLSRW